MQPIGTFWTILVEDHLGIIPVEFSQIHISGLGNEVVRNFPYIIQGKIVTPRSGSILTPTWHILNNLVRGPPDDDIY